MMATPYRPPQHRLARMKPKWIFMGIIAVLAFLSSLGLYKSGVYEFISGVVVGAWICALAGFAYLLWREDEARE